MKTNLFLLSLFTTTVQLAGLSQAQASDASFLREFSTIPETQITLLEGKWDTNKNMGQIFISDALFPAVASCQALLDTGGTAAVASRLSEAYLTDSASLEFSTAALALLADAGYGSRSPLPKASFRSEKENPETLTANVTEVVRKLQGSGMPYASAAAVEFILQIHAEGLITLSNASGSGNRKSTLVPHQITALATPYLEHPDPFVQAMADWALSIAVNNENDNSGSKKPWPPRDGEGPSWFQAYMAKDAAYHLPFDYARQVITLGMHRRREDLLRLSTDIGRRAIERGQWLIREGGNEVLVTTNTQAMKKAWSDLSRFADSGDDTQFHSAWLAWRRRVRDLVLQGSDVDFDSMVYIKRHSAQTHLQPGAHSAGQFANGGDIFIQTGFDPRAPTRSLVADQLGGGFGHDLDLHWDAERIVFSWKAGKSNLQKIYEVDLNGSDLKPVTDGPFDDVDPAYLPDDEVVFGSTRGSVGIMCATSLDKLGSNGASGVWNGLHTNIYRTRNGFSDILRLSYCKDDDAYPHVLNDGRIVFMRWDYQERGVNQLFTLWVINPDGTGADGFHKVHIPSDEMVQALRDTRAVENSSLLISSGGGHYNYSEGCLVLGDPRMGINNPESLANLTPFSSPVLHGWGELQTVAEGGVPYFGGYYCKPWPLSEKSFLASATFDQPNSNNFQLYYLDVWGNMELIQRDKIFETVAAAPIRKRTRPSVLPDRRNEELSYATLYMGDVYADLPGVEEGEVKYLRILQMIHWLRETGENGVQWHPKANPGEAFAFGTGGPVRTVGIVPVSEDGSAYFEVPSDADIYFQALDKDFRAVQRMRTHVEFAPGEIRGCIGCHETKSDVVNVQSMGRALATMKPNRPKPPPWGDQTFINYEKHIQPIFNAKCVECHAGKADQGWLDLSAKRGPFGFMQGYRAFYGLKATDPTPLVDWTVTGVKPRKVKTPRNHDHPWWKVMKDDILVREDGDMGRVTPPKRFGSVRHPFATHLVEDPEHRKRLSNEELQLLMNFLDVQAPYFETFRQRSGKNLIQIRLKPYAPFSKNRQHHIEHGIDVTPTL